MEPMFGAPHEQQEIPRRDAIQAERPVAPVAALVSGPALPQFSTVAPATGLPPLSTTMPATDRSCSTTIGWKSIGFSPSALIVSLPATMTSPGSTTRR